jgi:signal recognition particle subunit SRP72
LVALAVSLYHLHGRRQSATAELAKAAEHHAKGQGFLSTSLLREAGLGLVVSPDNEDTSVAVGAFAQALSLVADDPLSIAGSVAATSAAGDAVGRGFLDRLPAAEELVASTNVASLLSTGVVSGLSNAGGQAKRKDPPSQTRASAKKRRRRMPKNMDEGKQPDPERWLALRDRSSYRPKGKKGKKKANEATQGGIVKEEETLELVGGAGAVKVEKAASNVSSKKKKKPRK